jgi:O-antigen/teichoic acid export membrane protein
MGMHIGKHDVLWNYAATILQIASSVILFPFIIRILPPETVAIWMIFAAVIGFVGLLDFGFNPSFARNVSYVVSGVKTLKSIGFDLPGNDIPEVDYGLLKGLIRTMRLFYSLTALFLILILATIGTHYIHTLLNGYTGNSGEIYAAWSILCIINAYSFYTSYYDALLQGKGLIKRIKQIIIIGQSVYLIAAIILAVLGFRLIAIVSAQALSIIIRRIFAYRSVYTTDFKRRIQDAERCPGRNILSAIYPNAVKSGLTGVGGFLVNRSALIVGALYLSLDIIASYGITMQVIGVINGIAMVYFSTYQPKVVQYRVQNNVAGIKNLYLRGCFFLAITYVICGLPFIET